EGRIDSCARWYRPLSIASTLSLYYYARPPDLHSFPTRRSSDLRGPPPSRAGTRTARSRSPRDPPRSRGRGFRDRGGSRGDRDLADRKSTRLNSSHVAISYAVFCLKKKNRASEHESPLVSACVRD